MIENAELAKRVDRGAVRDDLLRLLSSSILVGALAGFLVGGVLGRLAMRLLTLTSPSELRGRVTDDAATVGDITLGGSISLALFTALLGILGGLGYSLATRVLPRTSLTRVIAFAALSTCVGGALLLHDHPSFDFTELQPSWLAVSLFLVLPAIFGTLVALGIDWARRPDTWPQRLPLMVPTTAAAVISLPVLPVVLLAGLASFTVRLNSTLHKYWSSPLITYLGLGIYALLLIWGLYGITSDIYSMWTDEPSRAPFTL